MRVKEKPLIKARAINRIIVEDAKRMEELHAYFNPITGEGAILEREKVVISDFPIQTQYLPRQMLRVPLVRQLTEAGSVDSFLKTLTQHPTSSDREKVIEQFVRIRIVYDFCFWAASLAYIKQKGGGGDVLFVLNKPQRKLIAFFEKLRIAGLPIRLILLKARQWGGSTATQMYFAWLQLVHKVGLNSLIVAHVKDTSTEIKDMFDRMMSHYPVSFLYELGEVYNPNAPKMVGVGNSGNIHRIPQRNCKIKIGTAEKPNSARGGDYNLVHCSEVALWKKTEGKTPEQIIRSACSGILLLPFTMIVYESTANGTGNFFQREYDAAKRGISQFKAMFISWFEIEIYSLPFKDKTEKKAFAAWLWENRLNKNVFSEREESGAYLWWLWEKGASLSAIRWYIEERKKYTDHGDMASEYPSDDVEAFVHSGARVFEKQKVDELRKGCRPPKYIGEVAARMGEGKEALTDLRFIEDKQGLLWIWDLPDIDPDEKVTNRYLTIVDIGGRSKKSDWSVITVFDRLYMGDGDKPIVVAQWYGHTDMDLLAWKSVQIAAYYDNAYLVIESNTLETHDKERQVDGDQSQYILNQIKSVYSNLYARKQSEEDIEEGRPKKYGFHTNVETKPKIISTLIKVVREGLYVERDERCLDEYITYERKQNGAYGAIPGKHDDLLMTRAIGLHIAFYEMDMPVVVPRKKKTQTKTKVAISAATI